MTQACYRREVQVRPNDTSGLRQGHCGRTVLRRIVHCLECTRVMPGWRYASQKWSYQKTSDPPCIAFGRFAGWHCVAVILSLRIEYNRLKRPSLTGYTHFAK